ASMSRKRVRRSRFPLATNRWLQSRSGIRVIRPCCPHEYLGFGAGTDFESKLVVKRNAAALLREAFLKPSWMGELVVFSGVTDCNQPVEASLGLTRACLEVCVEFRNPVAIITKGALVLRDLEQRLAPCDHGVRRLDPARVPQRGSPRYTASRFAR